VLPADGKKFVRTPTPATKFNAAPAASFNPDSSQKQHALNYLARPRWRWRRCRGSTLPGELHRLGYALEQVGEGQRILPFAIIEKVITEGSTVPIRVTHAGITKVERYSFSMT
jgi:hypothetical protein